MKYRHRVMFLLAALALVRPAAAEHLLMVRSPQTFPEAMLALQDAIKHHGYTLARVQRVDIGLTSSGYKTDKYRIVFFAKPEEQRQLTRRYPQLIPFLPLKMTIFAEADDTLVVTADPTKMVELAPDPEVEALFHRWRTDIEAIMDDLRGAEGF